METAKRSFGEMAGDTHILINFITMKMTKEGVDFISYADLNASIGGRNVQDGARGILATARKNVEKENQIVIETVPKQGIKKSGEYIGVLSRATKSIGRLSGRAVRRVANALTDKELTNTERIEIGARMSALSAIKICTKDKNTKRIEGKLRDITARELPTAETLRLFEK